MMTMFLVPFFPISPMFSFVGMCLMYIVEKINICYNYKRPEKLRGSISIIYICYTKYAIFFFCLANFLTHQHNTLWYLLMAIFSGVFTLIPFYYLREYFEIIPSKIVSSNNTFEDKFFEFGANYEIMNPVTRNFGIKSYLNKMVERKIITQLEMDQFLNNENKDSNISNVVELYYSKKKLQKPAGLMKLTNCRCLNHHPKKNLDHPLFKNILKKKSINEGVDSKNLLAKLPHMFEGNLDA